MVKARNNLPSLWKEATIPFSFQIQTFKKVNLLKILTIQIPKQHISPFISNSDKEELRASRKGQINNQQILINQLNTKHNKPRCQVKLLPKTRRHLRYKKFSRVIIT